MSGEPAPAAVIVGLGNPGESYRDTPHNVGHAVLDRLAEHLTLEWQETPDCHLGRGLWNGKAVCLVKPTAFMNHTGRALKTIAARLGVGPDECVLVFDDHDLPLGTIRRRQRGSDGGHRGVRSILEAFQTDQFLFSKKPVRKIDDLKSLKTRVHSVAIAQLTAGLGGDPLTVAFAEVYTALERGTLEAVEQAERVAATDEHGLGRLDLSPCARPFIEPIDLDSELSEAFAGFRCIPRLIGEGVGHEQQARDAGEMLLDLGDGVIEIAASELTRVAEQEQAHQPARRTRSVCRARSGIPRSAMA